MVITMQTSRIERIKKSAATVTSVHPFDDMKLPGMTEQAVLDRQGKARAAIGNADRPSNLWYKITERSAYWYMYKLMDWYVSEVSILSTILLRSTNEVFRYGLALDERFLYKCMDCGCEIDTLESHCPHCNSTRLRRPDPKKKDYFRRANGKLFTDEANDNGESLEAVLKAYTESQYRNNEGYLLCVSGELYDKDTGRLLGNARPMEFIFIDPKFVRYLYDDTGKPGTRYAFTRNDRHTLIDLDQSEDALNLETEEGMELVPALWQIGTNYGGTGEYWLYTNEEVYHDHWFRQSMTYGIPIGYDIEDDLLTYHYIEKHDLKLYKFGFLRKLIILPGFNEDDADDIIKDIQDILATNDNSIPIVCLPPQLPGTAEMKAQAIELGTEDAMSLINKKNEIRDRICAHWGVPNVFAGDVTQSGGMNNESQQITVFDRYLMGSFKALDRACEWILNSWFPVTAEDYVLHVIRPGKADLDSRRFNDEIDKMTKMKQAGYDAKFINGRFYYSSEPLDQIQRRQQEAMQSQAPLNPDNQEMDGEPPELGDMRREDDDVRGSKAEVDMSANEADDAAEV